MKIEYKVAPFQLKTTDDGRGEFTGCANFCGFLDDGGDVIPAGGFNDVLKSFLKGGFIAHSHEWNIKDGVIGYPTEAHEDEDGLFIRGKFHSTTDAQDIRTKMRERSEDGLEVGLSIGYRGGSPIFIYPKDYEKELPKYLKPQFVDEGLQKAKRFKNVRVLPKLSELKEVSIVTSPMNVLSAVGGVKENKPAVESEAETVEEIFNLFAPLSTKWDAAAALKRISAWSKEHEQPDESFKRAFLLPDNNDGIHKFLIADIIDDEFCVVEAGLKAAVDEILNTPMPSGTLAKLRGRVSAYYSALSAQFPDVKVRTEWDEKLDEVGSEIEAESYRNTCKELGIDEAKAGARNAMPDRKRIQQMHDLAAEMQPDVCPGYSKKACTCQSNEKDESPAEDDAADEATQKKPKQSKADEEPAAAEITDIDDWKGQRFRTEKLKTAALRQRAGLNSGLGGA